MHREIDRYHFYDHGLIVRQRLHKNNIKLDRMLAPCELPTNVQAHDECNFDSYTAYYLLFYELKPNVVVASDGKPSSSFFPER